MLAIPGKKSQSHKLEFFPLILYCELPFLFELRCVLDWSCTTTALDIHDWLQLENIYRNLFLVQCDTVISLKVKFQTKAIRIFWAIESISLLLLPNSTESILECGTESHEELRICLAVLTG